MKIVEVIPSLSKRAGAEVFLLNLVKELNFSEDVVVVSLYDEIDSTIEKSLNDLGIKIYYCHKNVGIDFKCSRNFKKIINEIKPDVVHMHLNCVSTYFFAFSFKKQEFSVYLTVHSLVGKDFKRIERLLIKKYVRKKVLTLVGISKLITNNIKSFLGTDSVVTINNGTSLFDSVYREPNSDVIIITCVAAFRPEKNQEMLVSTFLNAQARCSKKIQLHFVGEGPNLQQIKRKVDESKCENIIFYGQRNNVYPFLKDSHIFCLSSKYEGNPISIIEAMSVGLPIIAPNVGGIPDVVKDGINGRLFIKENKDDLLLKIIDLVNDDEKRLLIRQNNIVESKQYSIQVCAEKYLKLFKEKENND